MNMMAGSVWRFKQKKPAAEPIACGDMHSDQTAANAAAVAERALDRNGISPPLAMCATADGADAAQQEAERLLDSLHARSGRDGPRPSIVEHCCIHGKALEENGGLAVSFPHLEDALRLLWEIIAGPDGRPDEYERVWTVRCGLPLSDFRRSLRQLPEPTTSKWQVMYQCSFLLLPLVCPRPDTTALPMIEVFINELLQLHCGSLDVAKATRVLHPHANKIKLLAGLVSDMDMIAGCYLLVDVWEGAYARFHKFARSPSRYGGFEQPMLRHMMAEQAGLEIAAKICNCNVCNS